MPIRPSYWHGMRKPVRAARFLTHGEESTMQQFAARLVNTRIEMPSLHQSFELTEQSGTY
jgi:hypothetical protein